MGEKANEVAKKKQTILLRDVKTINCAPVSNDKRQQLPLGIEIGTNDRDHLFLVITAAEKIEFITNLKKVCSHIKRISTYLCYLCCCFFLQKIVAYYLKNSREKPKFLNLPSDDDDDSIVSK